jgi:hypothetical protein
MKPSDIFGVVVRTFGFVIIIWGCWNALAGLVIALEPTAQTHRPPEDQYSALSYLGTGIPAIVFGAVCFFCADWIVRLTYREK